MIAIGLCVGSAIAASALVPFGHALAGGLGRTYPSAGAGRCQRGMLWCSPSRAIGGAT
jgi:hypothetical protein